MTTVAYDGRYLAADTRATSGTSLNGMYYCAHCGEEHHAVQDNTSKLLNLDDANVHFRGERVRAAGRAGFSGLSKTLLGILQQCGNDAEKVIRTMRTLQLRQVADLMVITDKSVFMLRYQDSNLSVKHHPLTAQLTIGSGGAAARFLMKMGGNMAPTAIAAAALADKSTGGKIHVLDTHAKGKDFNINIFPMRTAQEVRDSLATVLGSVSDTLISTVLTLPEETNPVT